MQGEALKIYSDGACSGNPGIGGWAAIIPKKRSIITLSGGCEDTTNNRMELLSVIKGLTYALEKGYSEVEIYSDSAYVVNAINKGWLKSWLTSNWKKKDGSLVKNTDIWRQFVEVSDQFDNVKFIKVKGHNGNMYNEIADRYAKEEVRKLMT